MNELGKKEYKDSDEVYKQPIPVEISEPFTEDTFMETKEGIVKTPWGAELHAKVGGYLIMESPEDMWVIDKEIYEETYVKA